MQPLQSDTGPANLALNLEEIQLRANALFQGDQAKDLRSVIAEKIDALRHYDVPAMQRVVAILPWGRSGSVLLSSYFDGHADVIMLPELCGWGLHEFFERYQPLPLRDKLLAYAVFQPEHTRFFEGDFAISSTQYYAAVQAIVEVYGEWPPDFLKSRRAFFLYVHIAYNMALGRQPASSHPVIVYAQHDWDNAASGHLVQDFPQAKFVHTIRDPISSCDALFHFHLDELAEHDIQLPLSVLRYLTSPIDHPQSGMESRTRAIRFEDLHAATTGIMHDLADWVGLPYQAVLVDSTFNGTSYVIARDGTAWSGRRLQQIQRHSRYISRKDRMLLYAVFYHNLVDWKYPCRRIYGNPLVRCIAVAALVLVPLKMEMIGARVIFKRRIMPSLRRGNILRVIKSIVGIGFCRLRIIRLLVSVVFERCVHRPALLQVDHKDQPLERRDDGARAARNENVVRSGN